MNNLPNHRDNNNNDSNPNEQQSSSLSYQVQLAIYDLSHGMARNLSAQLLGGPQHAIPIIPHTAILVYGREYYFGGGIQSALPQEFRQSTGMIPIQLEELGRTRVSQRQFESWCQMQSMRGANGGGRYHATSYDLLQRNCNHFSHDAALHGLQLSKGVPEWILQVPQRFLASPMGQLIRPMLEQMQITSTTTPAAATTSFPTDTVSAASLLSPLPHRRRSPPPPSVDSSRVVPTNPWAQTDSSSSSLSPTRSQATMTATATTKSSSNDARTITTTTVKKHGKEATTFLDSLHAPLLSNETRTVAICISKLTAAVQNSHDDNNDNNNTATAAKVHSLEWIGNFLIHNKGHAQHFNPEDLEPPCQVILSLLRRPSIQPHATTNNSNTSESRNKNNNNNNNNASFITFALMLLRLVVLYPPPSSSSSWHACLEFVQSELFGEAAQKSNTIASPAARAMAWCVLSNAVGAMATTTTSTTGQTELSLSMPFLPLSSNNNTNEVDESWLQAALSDCLPESQPRVEIRQAASAFLYNIVLVMGIKQEENDHETTPTTTELSDLQVSLLCASLTNLMDETDSTTCLRRLMVVARLVQPSVTTNAIHQNTKPTRNSNMAAIQLIRDLELAASCLSVVAASNHPLTGNDADKCRKLALELMSIVEDGNGTS